MDIQHALTHLSTLSTGDKINTLAGWWQDKEFWLFEATWMGFNQVVKLEKCPRLDDDAPNTFTFAQFKILHQQLAREYDREAVIACAETAGQWEWNEFYRRVLMGEMNWITLDEFRHAIMRIVLVDKRAEVFLIPEYKLPVPTPITKAKIVGHIVCEPIGPGQRVTLHYPENQVRNAVGEIIPLSLTLPECEIPYVLDATLDGDFGISDFIPASEFIATPTTSTADRLDALLAVVSGRLPIIEKRIFNLPAEREKFLDYLAEQKRNKVKKILAKSLTSTYVREMHYEWYILNV